MSMGGRVPVESVRYMMVKQGVECWLNKHPELAVEAFRDGWMPHLYEYLRDAVHRSFRMGQETGAISIPQSHLAVLRQRGMKRHALTLASASEKVSEELV